MTHSVRLISFCLCVPSSAIYIDNLSTTGRPIYHLQLNCESTSHAHLIKDMCPFRSMAIATYMYMTLNCNYVKR